MFKKQLPLILSLLAGAAVTAALMLILAPQAEKPLLEVFGDVKEIVTITEPTELKAAVEAAVPWEKAYTVVIEGADGFAAALDGGDLEGCRLAYDEKSGWYVDDDTHPRSVGVKHIKSVIVAGALTDARPDGSHPGRVALVSGGNHYTSAGNLLTGTSQSLSVEQGTSEKNGHAVTVFTEVRGAVRLGELAAGDSFMAMSYGGQRAKVTPSAYLVPEKLTVSLYGENGKPLMEHVVGLYADPPPHLVTDVYTEALDELQNGKRVLVIELDGLGYDAAQRFLESGRLQLPGTLRPALTIYPPISPAGLAAMLTGEDGSVNGILDRESKDLLAPDLFAKAAELGATCAYIEGSGTLINTSLEPRLNPDADSNGTDNEVFASAVEALAGRPDLTFVHFHGIDDRLHEFGFDAPETLDKVGEVSGYAAELAAGFDGTVILTSDHGHHVVAGEDGTTHGSFCAEDMLVPYVTAAR